MSVIFMASGMLAVPPEGRSDEVHERHDLRQLVRPLASPEPIVLKEVDRFPLGEAAVLKVTRLDGSGPGTLRAAAAARGPRLVVFEVGGVIDLGGEPISVREPALFIAGETAPAPGITLIRGSLIIQTHDVIVRHLAIRPGDRGPDAKRPWEPDGVTIVRGAAPVHDVLIQNCSITWAVDENASASGPRDVRPKDGPDATAHDVTFRGNLIAEALLNSTHAKGPHSMGLLVHDGIRNALVSGNLFAHNRERNPRFKGGVTGAIVDNVIYNFGSAAIGVGARGNQETLDGVRAVVQGNVAIGGPDTKGKVLVRAVDPGAAIDASANLAQDVRGAELQELDAGITRVPAGGSSPAIERAALRDRVVAVLRGAGARPAERDPIDARIVRSVLDGSGRIIDSQEQVGGYPVRAETRRPLTVPAGRELRERFLDRFMKTLAIDSSVDATPLLSRLKLPL